MNDEVSFTIRGKHYRLTRQHVIEVMRNVQPERLQALAVEVSGVVYPVKQVFEKSTGLDRADFISHTARRQLMALDFRVLRVAVP